MSPKIVQLENSQECFFEIAPRSDGYCSNSVDWLRAIAASINSGIPLYYNERFPEGKWSQGTGFTIKDWMERPWVTNEPHHPRIKFRDGAAFHDILKRFSTNNKPPRKKILCPQYFYSNDKEVESLFKFYRETKVDGEYLNKTLFNFFAQKAKTNSWKLPCDKQQLLIIHVRLIEEGPSHRESMNANMGQVFCGIEHLEKVINKAKRLYGNHKIYIMMDINGTAGGGGEHAMRKSGYGDGGKLGRQIKEMLKRSNLSDQILGSSFLDKDLWTLMCANVLICSNSNFGLNAAVLNQGSKIYMMKAFNGLWRYFTEDFSAASKSSLREHKNKKPTDAMHKEILDALLEKEKYLKRF